MSLGQLQSRVRDDLQAALEETDADDPAEVAEFLVSEDSRSRVVIGLAGESRPVAILWSRSTETVSGFPADADVRGMRKRRVETVSSWKGIESWIHEQGAEHWYWLHPRFRWIFDG